jgi:magnesium transporter
VSVITCRLYREGQLKETGFDTELIDQFIAEEGALVWVDVEDPDQEAIAMLGDEFNFHPLALEDCLHPHQRPKVESYGSYFFLVAYGVGLEGLELIPHEIAAFVGRNYLVTVRKEPAFDIRRVTERWDVSSHLCREGGGFLLYILLDEVVDGYFVAVDAMEEMTDEIEDRVLRDEATAKARQDILMLKKRAFQFRRWVAPLRDVLDALQRRMIDVVTPPLEPYYRDVYDHVLRATDFVDNVRDILSSALDAHLSAVSNRLNETVKLLTSWAAIILVPTLIAGIYGMNFVHMPELNWVLGYPFALGLMAVSAFVLYRVFRKRNWL